MSTRSEPEVAAPLSDVTRERLAAPTGLLAATIPCESAGAASAVRARTFAGTTLRPWRSAVGAAPPAAAASASTTSASGTEPDPFDLDLPFRRAWLRPLRVLFDHYWRVEVSGLEHVPDTGPALIAANHSGAIPADAFML